MDSASPLEPPRARLVQRFHTFTQGRTKERRTPCLVGTGLSTVVSYRCPHLLSLLVLHSCRRYQGILVSGVPGLVTGAGVSMCGECGTNTLLNWTGTQPRQAMRI